MVLNSRDGAVISAHELNDEPRRPEEASLAKAGLRMALLRDSQAWRATRGAPFQFVRWLGALATVVADWIQSGTPHSTVAYVPVLAVVALLLLPDAQSIEIPGLKFDRLANEVTRQRRSVDRLSAEVSYINNSLIAGAQVNITMGPAAPSAAVRQPTAPMPQVRASDSVTA
jgi:hypothetical protein